MTSWKAEVIADASGKWCGNALRFKTKKEALTYADDLYLRWTAVRARRAKRCKDPVTHRWDDSAWHAVPVLGEEVTS